MSEINKEDFSHLGSKIENMLEEIIESDDEEFDNNPIKNSLKINEELYLKDEMENNINLLDKNKDIFSNVFSPNDKQNKKKNNNHNVCHHSEISNSSDSINQPMLTKFNSTSNINYNQCYFNHLISPPINININNNNKFDSVQDSFNIMTNNQSNINLNINQNLFNNNDINYQNDNIYLNKLKTTDFLSLGTSNDKNFKSFDIKSLIFIENNNFNFNSFINCKDYSYSFYKDINSNNFKRTIKNNNSSYFTDKMFSNQKILNYNNNRLNSELEILLIETYKILIKLEKISQNCLNKLKGKFEQIIRTNKGSRLFQNYLKNTKIDILHQIFLEIKNKLSDLLKDNYANYFCKKLFDCLNQKDRIEYLSLIQKDLGILAIDVTATYPIQGIIEQLGSIAEKNIIYLGIKDYIKIFCYNTYGAYVIEKILSNFEDRFIQEIIDFACNNFLDLAYHVNGVCVVKKIILMTHKKELHKKIKKKIYDNTLKLIVHQYGNYVIQVIIENWEDNEIKEIIDLCKDKYVSLSNQKYSSNVVERIIEKNKENLEYYIEQICCENNLIEVIRNNFGNYVIQKAVKLSSRKMRKKLISKIIKNLNKLGDEKIINKWKYIISNANF